MLYLLVAALGVGCLFQTPLIGLQAAMPLKDMATSTSTFGFIRTLGGTVGISVGQAILSGVSYPPFILPLLQPGTPVYDSVIECHGFLTF